MTTPAPIADAAGPVTPDLFGRVLRYVQIPDWRPAGARPVKGATIKAIARELAEYADWKTGDGAYPSIAALAVGAQVNYRTAAAAVAALVHYRLIALARDNAGRHVPNEYRLLNPMTSGLTVLNPDQFRTAALEVQDKVKGKAPDAPPPPAPQDTVSRGAEHGVTQTRDTVSQPPQQVPPSTNSTDHVARIDHHRAREPRRQADPPTEVSPPDTHPDQPLTSDEIRERALGRRRHTLTTVGNGPG